MRIRAAEITDIESIANVSIKSWRYAYANILPANILDSLSINNLITEWQGRLTRKNSWTLVAELDGSIVGFMSFGDYRLDSNKNIAEIYTIYVDPDYWSVGIGSELFAKGLKEIIEQNFNSIVLWVFAKNQIGRRFYEKNGFIETQETKVDPRLDNLIEIKYLKVLAN
jgi:ribosomal protein S18 acetylase RimI-like enzyme